MRSQPNRASGLKAHFPFGPCSAALPGLQATSPASLVTAAPWNSSLIRLSNSTRNASLRASPIGCSCLAGIEVQKTLALRDETHHGFTNCGNLSGKSRVIQPSRTGGAVRYLRGGDYLYCGSLSFQYTLVLQICLFSFAAVLDMAMAAIFVAVDGGDAISLVRLGHVLPTPTTLIARSYAN